jgi:hypothetical protein
VNRLQTQTRSFNAKAQGRQDAKKRRETGAGGWRVPTGERIWRGMGRGAMTPTRGFTWEFSERFLKEPAPALRVIGDWTIMEKTCNSLARRVDYKKCPPIRTQAKNQMVNIS